MCMYVCACHVRAGTYRGWRRRMGLLKLELWVACCGCWELNTGPPEDYQIVVTTEQYLKTFKLANCFGVQFLPL